MAKAPAKKAPVATGLKAQKKVKITRYKRTSIGRYATRLNKHKRVKRHYRGQGRP